MLSASLLPTGHLKYLQIEELGCSPALSSTHSLIKVITYFCDFGLKNCQDMMMPILLKLPSPKLLKDRYPSWEWNQLMGLTIQHSKLSKTSSHCGNITQFFLHIISVLQALGIEEVLQRPCWQGLAENSFMAQIRYFTLYDHLLGLLSLLVNSNTLMWVKPCFQELACTTAGKSASIFPCRSWEQVQGCSTSGVPPSYSLYHTGTTLGNTTISKQQSKKRCKEYSKCLLCIKSTANKPYS